MYALLDQHFDMGVIMNSRSIIIYCCLLFILTVRYSYERLNNLIIFALFYFRFFKVFKKYDSTLEKASLSLFRQAFRGSFLPSQNLYDTTKHQSLQPTSRRKRKSCNDRFLSALHVPPAANLLLRQDTRVRELTVYPRQTSRETGRRARRRTGEKRSSIKTRLSRASQCCTRSHNMPCNGSKEERASEVRPKVRYYALSP